ncbi:DEAD/DEAH box helicase [Variovorax paradoxus]|uniref:ATP-dependent RNA helicase RhlE n=1 Tax=Variovorax paradoxus TaxID=34073 RepID=A0A679IPW9_VARPD|nr:ATP-dependent RNA helicase RhlE [Variovorax paradoxus]
MPFDSLGLVPALVHAAAESGYAAPTAIQAAAIPAILQGRDVRGSAQTGSGKTAAFSLPLLQRLVAEPARGPRRVRALVLVPTRELAAQVGETLRSLAQHLPERLKIVVAFGGVSINPQMMSLRGGADIVVATPGRLLDLADHNALKLGGVSMLVLDEADRLFDLGFAEELGRILALLPQQRQNLLFSATFPPAIQALADGMLREPAVVDVQGEPGTEPNIVQRVIEVDAIRRTQLLRHLLKQHEGEWDRVLVFVATQHAAQIVAEKLYKNGIYAVPFHGDIAQGTRTGILSQFKQNRWDVVIATDLAARGIDIAQLPVVINYDLPRSPTDYIHRIGRTGRAGESGLAISFVSASTEAHFRLIEKRQGLSLPRERVEGFEPTEVAVPVVDASGTGGIKGKRPSKKDKLRAAAAKAATQDESSGTPEKKD